MTGYRIQFEARAERTLDELQEELQLRILQRLARVVGAPALPGKRLERWEHVWSVRIGDYRAAYTLDEERRAIVVEFIGHRRDFYRRLERLPHLR